MDFRKPKTNEEIDILKIKSPGGYRNIREVVINEEDSWNKYLPAIELWEKVTDRKSPNPTCLINGEKRLNTAFSEWMMGLPENWINSVDLTYQQKCKLIGNGVVPQQAIFALNILLKDINYGNS
jgi:hypothetical protein